MRLIYLIVFAILFIAGCSSKKYFEPEDVTGNWKETKELDYGIIKKANDIALVGDDKILYNDSIKNIDLNESYELLSHSDRYIISSTIDGKLSLVDMDNNTSIDFDLKKTVATASTDGDVLAVLFADDEIGLYSLDTKKVIFKLQGNEALANDARITKPYFMKDLVLFFTLDGKAVIVNKKLKKKLRTIIVSSSEFFNNVIYFDIFNDKLIIATAYRVLLFGAKEVKFDVEARDITHDDKNIYVATKQGDIILMDKNLKVVKKQHFPFAHFLTLSRYKESVYALEKEGYLIKLSKDLMKYTIYDVDFDDESYILKEKDKLIVGNKEIRFE